MWAVMCVCVCLCAVFMCRDKRWHSSHIWWISMWQATLIHLVPAPVATNSSSSSSSNANNSHIKIARIESASSLEAWRVRVCDVVFLSRFNFNIHSIRNGRLSLCPSRHTLIEFLKSKSNPEISRSVVHCMCVMHSIVVFNGRQQNNPDRANHSVFNVHDKFAYIVSDTCELNTVFRSIVDGIGLQWTKEIRSRNAKKCVNKKNERKKQTTNIKFTLTVESVGRPPHAHWIDVIPFMQMWKCINCFVNFPLALSIVECCVFVTTIPKDSRYFD